MDVLSWAERWHSLSLTAYLLSLGLELVHNSRCLYFEKNNILPRSLYKKNKQELLSTQKVLNEILNGTGARSCDTLILTEILYCRDKKVTQPGRNMSVIDSSAWVGSNRFYKACVLACHSACYWKVSMTAWIVLGPTQELSFLNHRVNMLELPEI